MSDDSPRFPVEVQVRRRNYGTLRSVDLQDDDSTASFVNTQDWRLETLSVESHVREILDLRQLNQTTQVGYVVVDPETLKWSFTPSADAPVS